MKVRILTTAGKQPEIVRAVETPNGIVFIDTLGVRHPAATVISYWKVETTMTNTYRLTDCTDPTHDHFTESGDAMTCEDCGQLAYYDGAREDYVHFGNVPNCFLIHHSGHPAWEPGK
jgi:hypothetical protein